MRRKAGNTGLARKRGNGVGRLLTCRRVPLASGVDDWENREEGRRNKQRDASHGWRSFADGFALSTPSCRDPRPQRLCRRVAGVRCSLLGLALSEENELKSARWSLKNWS